MHCPALNMSEEIVVRALQPTDVPAVVALFKSGMLFVVRQLTVEIFRDTALSAACLTLGLLATLAALLLQRISWGWAFAMLLAAVGADALVCYCVACMCQYGYIAYCMKDDLRDAMATYSQPGFCYFVAVPKRGPDGDILGTVAVYRKDAQTAELRRVVTNPAYRRMGVAKLLLRHSEAFCRAQGYKFIRLGTSSAQPAAMRMYSAAGYTAIESSTITPLLSGTSALALLGVGPELPGVLGITYWKDLSKGKPAR